MAAKYVPLAYLAAAESWRQACQWRGNRLKYQRSNYGRACRSSENGVVCEISLGERK
jgi:hypothetical protein